jgi:Domain of unknown function (DUF4160)
MATLTSDRVDRCRRCCGPAGPHRFLFYSSDAEEPPHVHVERNDGSAKFWLSPVRLQGSGGFKPVEVRRIQRLVERHREALLRSWDDYFNE